MEPQYWNTEYLEYVEYNSETNSYFIKLDKLWKLSPVVYRQHVLGGNMGIHNYVQSEENE